MIGEAGERDRKKKSFFKEKKNQTLLLYKPMLVCGLLTLPIGPSNTPVRVCDTAARCPRDAAQTSLHRHNRKSNSSSLHHRLVLRDLNYHPRQIPPQSTVTCAGHDRPAVRDHRPPLRTSPTDERTGEAPPDLPYENDPANHLCFVVSCWQYLPTYGGLVLDIDRQR